jgi:hypothetical protein
MPNKRKRGAGESKKKRVSERMVGLWVSGYYKNFPAEFWVYGLMDVKTEEIRYIGVTTNIGQRKRQHGKRWQPRTKLGQWLVAMRRVGIKLELRELERVGDGQDPLETETAWIWKLRKEGHRLVNVYPRYMDKKTYALLRKGGRWGWKWKNKVDSE